MDEITLSANAKKLLKHFQDNGFRERDYEIPAKQLALFEDAEHCEEAQAELAKADILELGPVTPHAASNVVSAALTLTGVRYLQKNTI